MSLVRPLAVASIVILVALVGACQPDDPTEPPDNGSSPSPAASLPTPSDDLPQLPKKATKYTENGALAFGKYYYDLINYGRATGNWKPAKQVTADSCTACKDFWTKQPKRMDNNLSIRFEDKPLVVRFLDREARVVFRVSSDRNITNIMREGREAWSDNLGMKYSEGAWKVTDLEIERSE